MDLFTSALDLAAAIKAKQLSPVDVVQSYLARIDKVNPQINAITWRRDEELLREAKAAEAAVMHKADLAPFHGVPIPIKDLTEVQGWPTTLGSKAALKKIGRHDSSAVRQIKKAGFLMLGRSNSPEFGTLPVTENTAYGATRNPWDLNRTPGGSSGGAAAAVAAGMAPIAHSSDGGGSTRIPASCCGLVGLKASRGRIPKGPLLTEVMHGFSSDGAITRTVADTAAMLDVLAHQDLDAWYNAPAPAKPYLQALDDNPGRLKIAYTTQGPFEFQSDTHGEVALQKTVQALKDIGHDVFAHTPDWILQGSVLARDFLSVWYTGPAYVDLADWGDVEPLNRAMRQQGMQQNSIDYVQAVMRLQVFSRRLVTQWRRDFDILLTPTIGMLPPPIGWVFATGLQDPEDLLMRCTAMVPYSGFCNVSGLPAISLPVHWTDKRIPVGVQLVGAPFAEETILQVAAQVEREFSWASARPPAFAGL